MNPFRNGLFGPFIEEFSIFLDCKKGLSNTERVRMASESDSSDEDIVEEETENKVEVVVKWGVAMIFQT